MDLPWNPSLGPLQISSHLLFEMLAYLLGFRLYLYLRSQKSDAISDERRLSIILGAILGALFGSRLLALLEHLALVSDFKDLLMHIFASKTIVGGLLGGLAGVEITKNIIGEQRSSGDLFTYPLILGIGVGRIGCFLSGVNDATHGLPTDAPWAMDLGDGVLRHPTALYEILFLAVLGLAMIGLERRRALPSGFRFQLFMTGYLIWRLWADHLKPSEPLFLTLSAIQFACALGLCYYGRVPIRLARILKGRGSDE